MDGKEHRHKSRRNVSRSSKKTTYEGYVQEIKKLILDYEKKFKEVGRSTESYEGFDQPYRGIGYHHDLDEEPCAVRSFMKQHPEHKGPVWIACLCPRCAIYC